MSSEVRGREQLFVTPKVVKAPNARTRKGQPARLALWLPPPRPGSPYPPLHRGNAVGAYALGHFAPYPPTHEVHLRHVPKLASLLNDVIAADAADVVVGPRQRGGEGLTLALQIVAAESK